MRYNFYECGIASSSALFRSCLESVWGHFSIDYPEARVAAIRPAPPDIIAFKNKHVCKCSAFRSG